MNPIRVVPMLVVSAFLGACNSNGSLIASYAANQSTDTTSRSTKHVESDLHQTNNRVFRSREIGRGQTTSTTTKTDNQNAQLMSPVTDGQSSSAHQSDAAKRQTTVAKTDTKPQMDTEPMPSWMSKTTPKVGSSDWQREKVETEKKEKELKDAIKGICRGC